MARIRRIEQGEWPTQNEAWIHGPCLYLIREGEDGPIKIGIASHPTRRLGTHQCGNPRRLHLIAVYVGSRDDCRAVEKETLSRFQRRSIRGEWLSVGADAVLEHLARYEELRVVA